MPQQRDPPTQEAFNKLPETLAQIRKDLAHGEPIRLMFQSEKFLAKHPDKVRHFDRLRTGFGRINGVRCRWASKPPCAPYAKPC